MINLRVLSSITFIGALCIFSTFTLFFFFHIKTLWLKAPPFVSTRKKLIPYIIGAMKMDENSVFYDLGSGDGTILKAVLERTNCVNVIGIELNMFAYLISKLRLLNKKVKLLNRDFYSVSFHDATHIYIYLLPDTLKKLELKILSECKEKTILINCDFRFPHLEPIEIINMPNTILGSHKLFIYKM